jgi:hypothetical protein
MPSAARTDQARGYWPLQKDDALFALSCIAAESSLCRRLDQAHGPAIFLLSSTRAYHCLLCGTRDRKSEDTLERTEYEEQVVNGTLQNR